MVKIGFSFGYHVDDPERYGVISFDSNGNIVFIDEKPLQPKSNYAVVDYILIQTVLLILPKN